MRRWIVWTLLAGCTAGEDLTTADGCLVEEGQWLLTYTLEAGSDPMCPEIEPEGSSVDGGGLSETDCEAGCDCTVDPFSPPSCQGAFHQTCPDVDVACTFDLDGPSSFSGRCDFTVHSPIGEVTCGYSLSAAPL